MERTQHDWQHDYLVSPWDYPISANDANSTYDQFIQLRDTLIFSGKYYNDKAGKKLCIWDKGDWTTTNTVEVWLTNYYRQNFNPWWQSAENRPLVLGSYITSIPADLLSTIWTLSCLIKKDGRYKIMHKEEILLSSSTDKVYCYVDVYRKDANNQYKIAIKWWIAVFDLEWAGWDYTLGQLFSKMPAQWSIETDLFKDDILVLRMKDQTYNSSTREPQGNDLNIQNNSNYWSIEYLDLPYNN
jgi:hypothetical protein